MNFDIMKNKFKIHLIFWVVYFVYITYAEVAYLQNFLPVNVTSKGFFEVLYYALITELVMMFSVIPCFYFLLRVSDSKFFTGIQKMGLSLFILSFFIIVFRLSINDFVFVYIADQRFVFFIVECEYLPVST